MHNSSNSDENLPICFQDMYVDIALIGFLISIFKKIPIFARFLVFLTIVHRFAVQATRGQEKSRGLR